MSKRKRRKFTVEQKVRIIEEARAPNTTVSEVLRRHQLDEATFYRWERQAKDGAREALEGRVARNGKASERETPARVLRFQRYNRSASLR
jgi:transposase